MRRQETEKVDASGESKSGMGELRMAEGARTQVY